MATDYTTLITSEHQNKPNFASVISTLTQPLGQIGDLCAAMPTQVSDVDTAVGVQLDTIGLWVGISRKQEIPLPNVFFSFDTTGLGFDQGVWLGPYESTDGVTVLDDETYRAVLKATIGANYWDGSVQGLNNISTQAVAHLGVECFALDNFDMTVTIYIIGAPSALFLSLIQRGIIPPKTAGIGITGYILASEAGSPFFALDSFTTTEVAGLDFGSFGAPV